MQTSQARVHPERPVDRQDLPRPASVSLDLRCVAARPVRVSVLAITQEALVVALQERDEARDAVRLLHDLWNQARRAA